MKRLFALAAVVAAGVASVAAIAEATPGNGANTVTVCKLVGQPSDSFNQPGDGVIYVNPNAVQNSPRFADAQLSPTGTNGSCEEPVVVTPLTPAASPAAAAVTASAARLTG